MTVSHRTGSFRELAKRIELAQTFVLTAHINPDGDAIGSEIALFHYLKGLNKSVHILNISATPSSFDFLQGSAAVQKYISEQHGFYVDSCDLLICLDIGDFSRCGEIGKRALKAGRSIISIDHHPSMGETHYTQEIVDTGSCSTGSILFRFMEESSPDRLNRNIAEALYLAIVTDTGNFRYNNSSAETHRIAAALLSYDIDPSFIYTQAYESYSLPRMQLLGEVLQSLQIDCEGRLAWANISLEMMQRHGARQDDTDGFSDMIRSIRGVEVAMMIKERDDGSTRLNWRSKGQIEMAAVARRFGGGGHPFACGATPDFPFRDAPARVLPAVREHLAKYKVEKG